MIKERLILFDVETTDLALSPVEIVQVGALKLTPDLEIEDEISFLVRPQNLQNFSEFYEDLLGISAEQLEMALTWRNLWKNFSKFTEFNRIRMCGWNVAFDIRHLLLEYERINVGFPHSTDIFDLKSMYYAWSTLNCRKQPNYSLRTTCRVLGIPEPAHSPVEECKVYLQILRKMYKKEGDTEIEVYSL